MKTRLCLLILVLSINALAYGQGEKKPRDEEDYTPRTLNELSRLLPEPIRAAVAEHAAQGNDDLRIIVHGELLPSRVKVVYEGTTRPLIEDKKTVIRGWANRLGGAPEFYTAPYGTEALFTDNGQNHWVVIKNEFLPQFEQELRKGDTVELFLIKMGNIRINRTDDKLEPVILVEKFLKQ